MRSIDEWIGPTDETRAPPRVRASIFDRDDSCHLCGEPIPKCHVEQTALDVAEMPNWQPFARGTSASPGPEQSIRSVGFPQPIEARSPIETRVATLLCCTR